jgi:UDP-glucose 4-epimerase
LTTVLVTGGGGFIGSHLAGALLERGHRVRVLDNFATGARSNVLTLGDEIELIEGDIQSYERVTNAVAGCEVVLHQAALPSVPRSVQDPLTSNATNVVGTLNVLLAARDHDVRRVVYASSSSVYGASAGSGAKREDQPTLPISPYATAKLAGEGYARSFHEVYGLETVALRYFNVFGPRQDPNSEYAAVIPRFILWGQQGKPLQVHGDGTQSRDFTYIDNVVSANLLAARADAARVSGRAYNVGCGSRTSLLEIITMLEKMLGRSLTRKHSPGRAGDVPHTLADVSAAKRDFGYEPLVDFDEGLRRTVEFFTGRKLG